MCLALADCDFGESIFDDSLFVGLEATHYAVQTSAASSGVGGDIRGAGVSERCNSFMTRFY